MNIDNYIVCILAVNMIYAKIFTEDKILCDFLIISSKITNYVNILVK